jgi:hypothetical protein
MILDYYPLVYSKIGIVALELLSSREATDTDLLHVFRYIFPELRVSFL